MEETPQQQYQPKRNMRHEESKMQQAFIKWCRYQYPQHLVYAIPNGGVRSKIEAAIMKGEGVRKGIPDTFIAVPRAGYGGLYIEMKVLPNVPGPEQVAVMDQLVKAGYCCQVAFTLDQAILHTNTYLALSSPAEYYEPKMVEVIKFDFSEGEIDTTK